MIHHLILLEYEADVRLQQGKLISYSKKIALEVLGSVQCFSTKARWSQSALEALASQCPVVFARWDSREKKWMTASMIPRCRYVNPTAQAKACRLPEKRATQLASDILWTKIENQHLMLRVFDPLLGPLPKLKDNSFSRILRLEAQVCAVLLDALLQGGQHGPVCAGESQGGASAECGPELWLRLSVSRAGMAVRGLGAGAGRGHRPQTAAQPPLAGV